MNLHSGVPWVDADLEACVGCHEALWLGRQQVPLAFVSAGLGFLREPPAGGQEWGGLTVVSVCACVCACFIEISRISG